MFRSLSRYALAAAAALALLAAVPLALHAFAFDVTLRGLLLAEPVTTRLGGDTTRAITSDDTFSFIATNAPVERSRSFSFGNRLFNANWVAYPGPVKDFDGLGPTFNRDSCAGCHAHDGRGRPPEGPNDPMESMLVRLSVRDADGKVVPHPAYGDQLNEHAIPHLSPEGHAFVDYDEIAGTYGDGTAYALIKPRLRFTDLAFGPLDDAMTSPRVAPQMIGLGLLEAVPVETMEALADPDDADGDGISGRINWLGGPDGERVPGRFGWKANVATLRDQTVGAALGDIGLTSTTDPNQNCPPVQNACREAAADPVPELKDSFVDRLVIYAQTLAVPEARDLAAPSVARGEALFRRFGCAACHMPTLKTGVAALPELANQTFHPFTDLLIHDMGEGLADHRPDGSASGTEWRTPPLWGLGLVPRINGHDRLLHDGRARGFAEAILWHGGEAEKAREAFRSAPADDRAALVAFLSAL